MAVGRSAVQPKTGSEAAYKDGWMRVDTVDDLINLLERWEDMDAKDIRMRGDHDENGRVAVRPTQDEDWYMLIEVGKWTDVRGL